MDERLNENERRFFKMVERCQLDARMREKLNGEINFKAIMRDGGIMDSYKEVKAREK